MTCHAEKYQEELQALESAKVAVIKARNSLKNAMANDIESLEQDGNVDGLKELRAILPLGEAKIVTVAIARCGGGMGKRRKS